MTELSALGEIGATPPVDLLSVLKYIPQRLWGNWRTRAALLRKSIIDLHSPLVDQVLQRREMIGQSNSFLDGVFDQQEKLELTRNEIDVMCGNLLEGGTDTMATTILTFCQAMAIHPEIQQEAHKQMDSVLSDSTPPSWSDYDQLPQVAMIVKELLRWRPPAPGAFPHALAKGTFSPPLVPGAASTSNLPLARRRNRRHAHPRRLHRRPQHLGPPPRPDPLPQPLRLHALPLLAPDRAGIRLRQRGRPGQTRPFRLRRRSAHLSWDPPRGAGALPRGRQAALGV